MKDSARPIVLVDMDGTVADATRRERQYLKRPKKNWPGFFREMEKDPPIQSVLDHVLKLQETHDIVILTGRPEKYKPQTEKWLKKHGVDYKKILMRRTGDTRPDFVAKPALLDELEGRKIVLALDDREPVCEAYRERGIRCFVVSSNAENQLINEFYQSEEAQAS
jgi:hypothetical protein